MTTIEYRQCKWGVLLYVMVNGTERGKINVECGYVAPIYKTGITYSTSDREYKSRSAKTVAGAIKAIEKRAEKFVSLLDFAADYNSGKAVAL